MCARSLSGEPTPFCSFIYKVFYLCVDYHSLLWKKIIAAEVGLSVIGWWCIYKQNMYSIIIVAKIQAGLWKPTVRSFFQSVDAKSAKFILLGSNYILIPWSYREVFPSRRALTYGWVQWHCLSCYVGLPCSLDVTYYSSAFMFFSLSVSHAIREP